jgi:hypothetical protein
MSEIKTGGPAFPTAEIFHDEVVYTGGMTMRDYFAAKAMQSLLARSTYGTIEDDPRDLSSVAYDYADAMIKAREAK